MSMTYAETCCLNEVIERVINGMNDHQRLKSRFRRFDHAHKWAMIEKLKKSLNWDIDTENGAFIFLSFLIEIDIFLKC